MIIGGALQAGCDTLYSEDFPHGQQIRGLRILNPFTTFRRVPPILLGYYHSVAFYTSLRPFVLFRIKPSPRIQLEKRDN